jgi:hypothetical protein
MNGKLYRCGWCGMITDEDGEPLDGEPFEKARRIIETYGDHRTHKLNGNCCPNGNEQDNMVQITRDMAIDAGDRSLEGEWIRW